MAVNFSACTLGAFYFPRHCAASPAPPGKLEFKEKQALAQAGRAQLAMLSIAFIQPEAPAQRQDMFRAGREVAHAGAFPADRLWPPFS
jgi:hypothetical protein